MGQFGTQSIHPMEAGLREEKKHVTDVGVHRKIVQNRNFTHLDELKQMLFYIPICVEPFLAN